MRCREMVEHVANAEALVELMKKECLDVRRDTGQLEAAIRFCHEMHCELLGGAVTGCGVQMHAFLGAVRKGAEWLAHDLHGLAGSILADVRFRFSR